MVQLLIENIESFTEEITTEIRETLRELRTRLNREISNYLQTTLEFFAAEDKIDFLIRHKGDRDIEKIKSIIRLVFCTSFKKALREDLFEESLFFQLNEIAQSDAEIKAAILQTFDIADADESLLRKENYITFIEHATENIVCLDKKFVDMFTEHKIYMEDLQERYGFIADQEDIGKDAVIQTDDKEIAIPKLFFTV